MKSPGDKILKVLNHKLVLILGIILLTAIYTTQADRNFGWTKTHEDDKTPIYSDASGYYVWLPEWFIYKDQAPYGFLEKIRARYPKAAFTANIAVKNGSPFNKYYPGTAVAMTPFFAVGHLIAKAENVPQDGYSKPYQMMAVISGIAYFLLGLVFITFLLRRFLIDRFWILVTLCIIAFGSNMGYYVYAYAPTSHVFSFAFCSLFALVAKMYADSRNIRLLYLLAAVLGMIFLIRPTNILIVLLLPFFFTDFKNFMLEIRRLLRAKKMVIALSALIFGLLVFFHLYNNHAQGGGWEINTYPDEKFDFLWNPKIGEVLFGFRKGFFIYAPALLLFFPGMFMIYRKNQFLFYGISLFFLLFTYVTASWWCWWYGGGLGMRPLLDILVVFAVPLAFLFQFGKTLIRILALLFVVVTCKMALTFDYQIRNNIMHYEDMNAEKFRRIFMHTEERFAWASHLDFDTLPKNAVRAGKPMSFRIHGNIFTSGTSEIIRSNDADSTLTLAYKTSHRKTGAKVYAEIRLFSEKTNPLFRFLFFSKGTAVLQREYYLGSFVPETEKFIPVIFDVYPETKEHIDSVAVSFDKNVDSLAIRNVRLQQFRIP